MKKLTDKNKRFIFGLIAIIALFGGWFMSDGTSSEIQLKDILPFDTQYVWMMKQARTILETYHEGHGGCLGRSLQQVCRS